MVQHRSRHTEQVPYNDYFEGKLSNHSFTENELKDGLAEIRTMQPTA